MSSEVLNSWKEIAAYLGRGVRTVQRWERELGLPVRRPRGKERSAVIALTPDLDRWLHKVPQGTLTMHPSNVQRRERLHLSTERLLMQIDQMVERSTRMRETAKATLVLTSKLREQQAQRTRERLLLTKQRTILLSKAQHLGARIEEGTTELLEEQVQIQKSSANSAG